jgi:hypothetical protein
MHNKMHKYARMEAQSEKTQSGDGAHQRGGRGGISEFAEELVDAAIFDSEREWDVTRVERGGGSHARSNGKEKGRRVKKGDGGTRWTLCWGGEAKQKEQGGGLVRVLVEERKGEGWVRRGLNPIENFKRIQIISKPSKVLDDPNRTFPSSKNLK